MITYTGRAFWPLDARPEEIDPCDIAHALSLLCRYGGHTRRDDARAAARKDGLDERFAASLRGKAIAYQEAG